MLDAPFLCFCYKNNDPCSILMIMITLPFTAVTNYLDILQFEFLALWQSPSSNYKFVDKYNCFQTIARFCFSYVDSLCEFRMLCLSLLARYVSLAVWNNST